MVKLIVVIMGPGKKHFAEMCLDSVKDADKILYWTSANFLPFPVTKDVEEHYNFWDETDPATNGKCRQRYLEHLKENYPDDWCLVLDEDELIEDLEKIREFINNPQTQKLGGAWQVKMRHFIGDLGHEDATVQEHYVPNRLFKISDAEYYPEHSHPILVTKGGQSQRYRATTIFHLGHLPVSYMDYILKRYKQHAKDSIIHNQEFLKQWKISHLLGVYPTRQINPLELPKQICDRYEIDKDEFYFADRKNLEAKHFMMIRNWFDKFNPKSILDIGCGFGLFGYAAKTINPEIEYTGVDISKYVGKYWNDNIGELIVNDITNVFINKHYDLILFIDILEHLLYEDLEIVLKNECNRDGAFIFSIPFEGDPNLEADATHIIKEDKDWWVEKLSKYFNIRDAPKEWLFSQQLLIGEKK